MTAQRGDPAVDVAVDDYNEQWPSDFSSIKSDLEQILQDVDYKSIEHVGSTSVPGLPAKPIIDIDVVVERNIVPEAIAALQTKGGYKYMGEWGIPDRHALRKPGLRPTRNLYVCVEGSVALRNHLGLRDILRIDPELREEYANVKIKNASSGMTLDDYTNAKSDIIYKILEKAGLTEADRDSIFSVNKKIDEPADAKSRETL
jgi:GrpB-like predicted nucleotidyltransferase (UPF0157 family)